MSIRTDLVSEQSTSGFTDATDFSQSDDKKIGGVTISCIEIKSEKAAKILSKPRGKYHTLKFDKLDRITDPSDIKSALSFSLNGLLPQKRDTILVVGLGNIDITPDALGPLTANSIMATRHIDSALKNLLQLDNLKNVSVITPGVLGKTGIEASDTIKAACQLIKPDAVIVIDALAARCPERLCQTIQLTDTGINPGSGVNNSRKAVNFQTIGVPVTAIGIPTVIDASTYRFDCGLENGNEEMMVTPKDIDLLIERASKIISQALNLFLQPSLDEETIISLM